MDETKTSMDLNFDFHQNGKTFISNVESSRLEVLVDRLAQVDFQLGHDKKILNGVETVVLLELDDSKGFKILDHVRGIFPGFASGAEYFEDVAPVYSHLVSDTLKVGFNSSQDSPFKTILYRTKDEGSGNEKVARKAALDDEGLLSKFLPGHVNLHDVYAFSVIVADGEMVYDAGSDTSDNPHRTEAIRRLDESGSLEKIDSEVHHKNNNYSAFHGTYFSTVQGAENLLFEVQIYTQSEWEQTRDGNPACHSAYKDKKFKDPHSDEGYQVVIFRAEDGLEAQYQVQAVSSKFVEKSHVIRFNPSIEGVLNDDHVVDMDAL